MARGAFEMVPLDASHVGDGGVQGCASPCKAPRKWVRWTGKLKQAFLDELASNCNVSASARAIGVHPSSVHILRRRDAEFSAGWQTALQLGYQMLETRLIGHVLSNGASEAITADMPDGPAFDPDQAMRILQLNRQTVKSGTTQRRGGPQPRRATPEETDATLAKQLDALARRLREDDA